jgi:hypothetical protein
MTYKSDLFLFKFFYLNIRQNYVCRISLWHKLWTWLIYSVQIFFFWVTSLCQAVGLTVEAGWLVGIIPGSNEEGLH